MANEIFTNKNYDLDNYLTPLQNNLIDILNKQGPLTRRELVKNLKTARTTIYDNLMKLKKRRIIEKFARNNGKRGRSLVYWKLKE